MDELQRQRLVRLHEAVVGRGEGHIDRGMLMAVRIGAERAIREGFYQGEISVVCRGRRSGCGHYIYTHICSST